MTRPVFLHRGRAITTTIDTRPALGARLRTAAGWLVLWVLLCVMAWLMMPAADAPPAAVARCSR